MAKIGSNSKQNSMPVSLAYAADFYQRYPGELITFYTQVDIGQSLPGLTLRVIIPAGLEVCTYRASSGYGSEIPRVEIDSAASHLIWQVEQAMAAGTRYECQVTVQVGKLASDASLTSQAVVMAGDETSFQAQETVTIAVSARGRYLKHLPALYEQDEFMGRFLMLFESFWAPIDGQLKSIPFYFDPQLTTVDVLPWLASWLDLVLDERWPEERRRLLLRSAAMLYRKRGTKQGLQEYLEIYSGEKAQIIERRAKNFKLGSEAILGPGIAFGTGNTPHTFTVSLRLPPIEVAGDEAEQARRELERRRIIEAIIEAEKPAHTAYTLDLEIKKS